MAADRGAFICQSQSLNVFIENPNFGKLSSMHFYGWQKGLKTGMYYLRSRPAVDPIKFTLSEKHQRKYSSKNKPSDKSPSNLKSSDKGGIEHNNADDLEFSSGDSCNMDDGCLMCGS